MLIVLIDLGNVFEGGVNVETELFGGGRVDVFDVGELVLQEFGLEGDVLEAAVLHPWEGKLYFLFLNFY